MKKVNNLSWIEINRDNIGHNIKAIKSILSQETRFIAVTKSNAYGHGIVEVSKIAAANGADMIGVISVEEAEILRKNKVRTPILILGYAPPQDLRKAVKLNCHLTVYNPETIKELGKLSRGSSARIHIKVETGTNRQGLSLSELPSFLKLISKYHNIEIIGLCSHFANAEDAMDQSFTKFQLTKFNKAIEICENFNIHPKIKHIAATAAAIIFPESHLDAVRVGIGMYGLWPSKEIKLFAKERHLNLKLRPALTWKTVVAQVKEVEPGDYIGYGCAEKVNNKAIIAILPIGYWDGYSRLLSKIGEVLIKGQRCRVLGRVCMNMIMVDVTRISNIELEDEAVLLGKQDGEEITAEELGEKSSTINYEVVTRINPLLPRRYI